MATTTKFWTWAQIKARMESELDMEEETFIDSDEFREYANDAIDVIEAHILNLSADYFLTRSTITLVDGTDEYALPSNIYAMKIRGLVYYNGSDIYEIRRIKQYQKFLEYRIARFEATSADDYMYFVYNEDISEPKILLSPASHEDGTYVEIWYLRQANRLELDADVCDIPEFISYIFDYLRERAFFKHQAGSAKHMMAREDRDASLQRAIDTLTNMTPDTDNEIEADLSIYREMA